MTTDPVLIGRDHPAEVLRSAVRRSAGSHGGLILVTGEAGIGKTTLVRRTAEEARREGALVLGGSCWDSAHTPGYWPWVQVLRALRREVPGALAGPAGPPDGGRAGRKGPLAALLGEGRADEGADEFALHDAVTTALVTAAQERPVLVVLDDLHWADGASLRLLEFAARHTWFERVLLVGAYRDSETRHPPPAGATTLVLTGLGRAATGALLARTTGREPSPELIDETHRRTGGNPFFIEQTAALGSVPPGVRDALHRRLRLLPAPVGALLTDAAVLGREFAVPLLAATAGMAVAEAEELLRQAFSARLVTTGEEPGRYAFAHDLVREVLYEALPPERSRERHAAAVRALEGAGRASAAELARHALPAGDALPVARRVEILTAAASEATHRLAHEEAVRHRRHAYEVARTAGDTRRQVRTGLSYAAALQRTGASARGWEILRDTADISLALADPGLLARVALSLFQTEGEGEQAFRTELLLAATRALDSVGRAAEAGAVEGWSGLEGLARKVALRAAVHARRGGDDEALAFSLWARHSTIWSPGHADEREVLTREIIALARRGDDLEAEHFGMALRWVTLVELGDPRFAEALREFTAVATRHGSPRFLVSVLVDESITAALRGDFALAERRLRELRVLDADTEMYAGQLAFTEIHLGWALGMLRGDVAGLEALTGRLDPEDHPCGELLAGITAAQRGDREAVLRALARTGKDGARYGGDVLALWLRFQAMAAAVTGDRELASHARDALAPFAREWAVSLYGFDIGGPLVLWRGVAESALGNADAAVAAFEAAVASAERMGARPWVVEAGSRLAAALAARGAAGDAERAAALGESVRTEAAALGMARLAGGRTPPAAGAGTAAGWTEQAARTEQAAAAEPAGNEFRLTDGVWTLTYDGVTVHVPDTKGLRDLRQLIAQPGTDIPAVRLLGGDGAGAAPAPGSDPVLDEEARARYRRHLAALDEEIDRAAALGKDDRAAALDAERAALLAELRAAAGLAGRPRRLGDAAERARKTVTARIRDTLRKLDARHPALAAHLRATVSTGTHCVYRPHDRPDPGTAPAHFRL
ncbi:ATP-binding protein [Streptomyces xiamenensis]|uniref:ATP-binding protein n=1 Tax=Streptomyces xiamenensis TaxID=408015 RepID=UPI0037D62CE5